MNEKTGPPIGMNEITAITRRYIMPPLEENLFANIKPGPPPSRWRRMTYPFSRRYWEAKVRIGHAWYALKGGDCL